ncbi:transcription initiation factor IIA subunit 2 isoform X2 [Prosopis cineraria]|uniref:transcription initiation factor IIA subunit 2 isoform X2 n=1 Tax=Prosopis cineraria TaxID=364024 RepID=UPI00240FD500|nr:transcription initiation factor IIA subunit 2 isoform X2 [Prosopis cineraria]
MATFELYRRSTIGMCLTETLDEMVQNGTLSPELAIQVLVQFDKSMHEALETQVKSKVSIKFLFNHRDIYIRTDSATMFGPSFCMMLFSRVTNAKRTSEG